MEIVTTLSSGDAFEGFNNIIERRADFALKRFRGDIQRMHVRFQGVNGLEGEAGVQCSILFNFFSHGRFVVQGGGLDVFSALNSCLKKIVEVVIIKKTEVVCYAGQPD